MANPYEVPTLYQGALGSSLADLGVDGGTSVNVGIETPALDNSMFSGLDLKGIGTIASVLGGLWGASEDRKYRKSMTKREDARIERDRNRQDKYHSELRAAYGIPS